MTELRPLPKSGVITEAGAYRIDIDTYHTQLCEGPSISSGGLRTIYHQSPGDFWAWSELNAGRYVKAESPALAFGRAAHALLLGDEVFDERFIILPDDAPQQPTSTQVRAAAEGRESKSYLERMTFWSRFSEMSAGRTVVEDGWMTHIEGMAESLARHPLVGPLFDGMAEVSLIWQDEQTGVWIKARPDMLPAMGSVKADLKTTTDCSLRAVIRDTAKFGYDMQAALGCIGCEKVLGQEVTSDVLVFVQKSPPYHVTPLEIPEETLHWAKLMCRVAINRFAECLAKNDWPGPVEGIPQYQPADWRLHEMGEGQAAGTFPKSYDAPFGAFGEKETADDE